jgi:hypothetical protein
MELLFCHKKNSSICRRYSPKKKTALVLFYLSQIDRFGKEFLKKEGALGGAPILDFFVGEGRLRAHAREL